MKALLPGGRYVLPSGERVRAAIHLLPDVIDRDHLYIVATDGEILRLGEGGVRAQDVTPADGMYVFPKARASTALTVDDLVAVLDPG